MKNILYSLIVTLILSIFFISYPELDVEFSRLFFSKSNQKFSYINNFSLNFISNFAYFLAFLFLAYNSILIIKSFLKTKSLNFNLYKPQIIVLLVFLIGSLTVVQIYSKHYFGRSRPANIQEFNGELTFTPAFKVSDQCKFNCSFVSFHTSIGFLFLVYSYSQVGRKRSVMIYSSCILIVILGLMRIIQGKHFLSDVVISACFMMITYYIILMLYDICCNKK